jgi:hypothetical protein
MEQKITLTESQLEFIQWKLDKLLLGVKEAQREMGFKPLIQEEDSGDSI